MAELVVVGFKKDMYRASEVLNELLELNDALQKMNGKVVRMAMRDFTIWPH